MEIWQRGEKEEMFECTVDKLERTNESRETKYFQRCSMLKVGLAGPTMHLWGC